MSAKAEYEMNLAGSGTFLFTTPRPRFRFQLESVEPEGGSVIIRSDNRRGRIVELNDGDYVRAGDLIVVEELGEVAVSKVRVSLTPEERE